MNSIQEVFDLFEASGTQCFSTIDENGQVQTRVAHFIACDEEGIYFTAMDVKPYGKQLFEGGKLAVCADVPEQRLYLDENNMPKMAPGYMIRITGDVRICDSDVILEKQKSNPKFNVVVHDFQKYPRTRCFVMYRAWAEKYSYDYNKIKKDHKLDRERFAFGGAVAPEPGLKIDPDVCIACGACFDICSFDAVEQGQTYFINGARCDECGNCLNVCPAGAISCKGLVL